MVEEQTGRRKLMLSKEKNDTLCRVEGDAPMGRLMRNYWLPACASSDLVAGGAPKRVKLLGEELVAYRSPNGTVGLIDEYCPHRGASMFLAQNEECGLRCIYHGWLMNGEGRVLETPPEPPESKLKERVKFGAYPVHESGGVIWTYMGEAGKAPPTPDFEFTGLKDDQIIIMRAREEANWAQCIEGVLDSAHSNYLHSNGIKANDVGTNTVLGTKAHLDRPSNDGAPKLDVETTPYGFRYAAIRRPLQNAERDKYIRVTLFVAPCYSIFPAANGWGNMQFFVPEADGSSMFWYVIWKRDGAIDQATRDRYLDNMGLRLGVDVDENQNKFVKRSNNWKQDRAAMMRGESFTGIRGVNIEDIVVHESMGPIYDRTKEHLGSSDLAVIHYRRMMIDAAERYAQTGATPPGLAEPVDYARLHAGEGMIPHSERWQIVMEDGPPEKQAAQ
jgi:phthalate 4,5-dioxygenase oxygenase subunit